MQDQIALEAIKCDMAKNAITSMYSKINSERRLKPSEHERIKIERELRSYDDATNTMRNLSAEEEASNIARRRMENVTRQYHFQKQTAAQMHLLRKKMKMLRREKTGVKQIVKTMKEEDKYADNEEFAEGLQDFLTTPHQSLGDYDYFTSNRESYLEDHDLISEIQSSLRRPQRQELHLPSVSDLNLPTTAELSPPPEADFSSLTDCFDKQCSMKDSKRARASKR